MVKVVGTCQCQKIMKLGVFLLLLRWNWFFGVSQDIIKGIPERNSNLQIFSQMVVTQRNFLFLLLFVFRHNSTSLRDHVRSTAPREQQAAVGMLVKRHLFRLVSRFIDRFILVQWEIWGIQYKFFDDIIFESVLHLHLMYLFFVMFQFSNLFC